MIYIWRHDGDRENHAAATCYRYRARVKEKHFDHPLYLYILFAPTTLPLMSTYVRLLTTSTKMQRVGSGCLWFALLAKNKYFSAFPCMYEHRVGGAQYFPFSVGFSCLRLYTPWGCTVVFPFDSYFIFFL